MRPLNVTDTYFANPFGSLVFNFTAWRGPRVKGEKSRTEGKKHLRWIHVARLHSPPQKNHGTAIKRKCLLNISFLPFAYNQRHNVIPLASRWLPRNDHHRQRPFFYAYWCTDIDQPVSRRLLEASPQRLLICLICPIRLKLRRRRKTRTAAAAWTTLWRRKWKLPVFQLASTGDVDSLSSISLLWASFRRRL